MTAESVLSNSKEPEEANETAVPGAALPKMKLPAMPYNGWTAWAPSSTKPIWGADSCARAAAATANVKKSVRIMDSPR